MKVYFVGAGPGDPELITVKGKRIIETADIIIYAGSLINTEILKVKDGAELIDSAALNLGELTEIFVRAKAEGMDVARVHAGDLSFYSAINEQIKQLRQHGVEYEIIPGVGAMAAAAAALETELTLPGVSQSVIVSRISGRTPVPNSESLAELARHRATICIYLSTHLISDVVAELIPAYGEETPAAIVARASWPDQKVIRTTLSKLADEARAAGIERTALIVVGDVLAGDGGDSMLYDASFTHGYRNRK